MEERHLLATVGIFANSDYVDIGAGGEEIDVAQALRDAGHFVQPWSGISASALNDAIQDNQALVIPELEAGDLADDLSGAALNVLRDYVDLGGSVVLFGSAGNDHELAMLSTVWQITAVSGPDSFGTRPASTLAAESAATLFAGGTASLADNNATSRLVTSSLPGSARSIYEEGSNSTVVVFRRGFGQIIYLGYDWFEAAPSPGTQDGGWNAVLDRAIDQATALTYDSVGSQDLILRHLGGAYQIVNAANGAVVAQRRDDEVNQIVVFSDANENTSLALDLNADFIAVPVRFEGGAGGNDVIGAIGGVVSNVTHTALGPQAGRINYNGTVVEYIDVELTNDRSTADNYTFIATDGADVMEVVNGPTLTGVASMTIRSTNGTFNPVNVTRKKDVTVNSAAGADTVSLNNPGGAFELQELTIDSGATSGDVVNVLAAADGVNTLVTSSGGTDTVNVGNAGRVSGILGKLTISNPPSFTALRIDDSAETAARNIEVRENRVRYEGAATIDYVENDISSLTVLAGSGGNTIGVDSTAAFKTTTIFSGNGADTFDIRGAFLGTGSNNQFNGQGGDDVFGIRAPVSAPVSIDGGTQNTADRLDYNAGGAAVTLRENSIAASGSQLVTFTALEAGSILTPGDIPSLTLESPSGGGTSTLTTGANTISGSAKVGAGPVFSFTQFAIGGAVVFNGSSADDRFEIDNAGTALLRAVVTIHGNGNTAAGDVLALRGAGNVVSSVIHNPSGPATGDVNINSGFLPIVYDGLEAIADTMTASFLALNTPADRADSIFYEDGAVDAATHQVRSEDGSFVTYRFNNKPVVSVITQSGASDQADAVNIIPSQAAAGLVNLGFFTGAGDDRILWALPFPGGAGLASFNVNGGAGGADRLTVAGSDGADTIQVNGFSVSSGGATLGFSVGVELLVVNGTAGDDTINVNQTTTVVAVSVEGGTGNDAVNVTPTSRVLDLIAAPVTVSGGPDADTLAVFDDNHAANSAYSFSATSISRGATGPINYSGFSNVVLNAGSGNNTLNVTGSAANITSTINAADGNDAFVINADGLGANSTNNFNGQGGDDTFTSGFSKDATINVDGGPQAVADTMRYDVAGLGLVLTANSVGVVGRLPINITNIEVQEIISGLGNIPSVTVLHSPLGGISTITTTANAHSATIKVQGGQTYSLFNLAVNVPINVVGSFLDDRLEIVNAGTVLLDAEIAFDGALNGVPGDSLAFSGGGNLVVNEIHSATGPKSGSFNFDNVLTVAYSNTESLTDTLLAFFLTYNTPAGAADQLSYGVATAIPDAHQVTSATNAFLAYPFGNKREVTVNTGSGNDTLNVAVAQPMSTLNGLSIQGGPGADTAVVDATSALLLVRVDLGAGAIDKLTVNTGDAPNNLTIDADSIDGANAPVQYAASVEELLVQGMAGDDAFLVTPSPSTKIVIDGGPHDAADTLQVDVLGQAVTATVDALTVAGRQPVQYLNIESGELLSTGGSIPTLGLSHDATGGTTTVHTGDTEHSGTFQVQRGTVFEFNDLAVDAVLGMVGAGGNDRFELIHDGDVLLNARITVQSQDAPAGDVLALSGNQPPLPDETHDPGGPTSGTLAFGSPLSINYAGLESIEDALPAVQLTWRAPLNNADDVLYENAAFSATAHQIRAGNAAFTTHQFTGKTNVTLRLDTGASDLADTLDVGVTQPAAGLASLALFTGAGDDIIEIDLTTGLAPTTLSAGTGIDSLFANGTTGDDAFTVNADSVAASGTSVTFSAIESLLVSGLAGSDTFSVPTIAATFATVIDAGAGNDAATVQAPLPRALEFRDGDGDDRLTLVGTNADERFDLGGTTVTGAGATINYSATLEHVTARGMGGLDEFFARPNTVTEFFADGGTPTGTLPGDRLEVDFAGTTGRRLTFGGPGAGAWTFTNRRNVGFTDIERFNFFDLLAAGADAGATSSPQVMLLDALTLEESIRLTAYEAAYQEGVRVALGDLNGDGVPELVTAPGRNRAPEIRVFDVTSGAELTQYRFSAYGAGFIGGVYVAVGDVDGDGWNDIITSPGRGVSDVRVYRNNIATQPSAPFAGAPYRQFSAFPSDFIGGASVAAADFTGDGRADIVLGSGSGMRATVSVYNVSANAASYTPLRQFFPFDTAFRGGANVSAGRINTDGVPDVIASQGPGGDANVEVFDGATGMRFSAFDAYTDASSTSPVRGVGADLDGDGVMERIVTGQGPDGRTSLIRRFTTSGALVDEVSESDPQFAAGFHMASFYANDDVLGALANPLPTTEDIVTKLYRQVLGRDPEPAGLAYWVERINAGATYGTIASGIFESAERLDPIIRQYYRDYLLREAEPAGVEFYREMWRRDGGPDNVVANIISSAEFYASAGGTNVLWVTELYRRLLGREPDAAGLNYWTARLDSGALSRQQVVFGFTRSDENFRSLITGWYRQYLNRLPTPDELDTRVIRMRNGASQRDIQIELIDSPEYSQTP